MWVLFAEDFALCRDSSINTFDHMIFQMRLIMKKSGFAHPGGTCFNFDNSMYNGYRLKGNCWTGMLLVLFELACIDVNVDRCVCLQTYKALLYR